MVLNDIGMVLFDTMMFPMTTMINTNANMNMNLIAWAPTNNVVTPQYLNQLG